MGYYITRQVRMDASHIVEITDEKDVINGDMLQPEYKGEGDLWIDPQAVVETAIMIRKLWQRDRTDVNITMAVGNATGYHPMNAHGLRVWAAVQVDLLPRCTWCGGIIYTDPIRMWTGTKTGVVNTFCSMGCAIEYHEDVTTPTIDKVARAVDEATNVFDDEAGDGDETE